MKENKIILISDIILDIPGKGIRTIPGYESAEIVFTESITTYLLSNIGSFNKYDFLVIHTYNFFRRYHGEQVISILSAVRNAAGIYSGTILISNGLLSYGSASRGSKKTYGEIYNTVSINSDTLNEITE